MAPRAFVVVVIATVSVVACDISQRHPEVGAVRVDVPRPAAPQPYLLPAWPGGSGPQGPEGAGGASGETEAGGEKSIRLFGPGVSRDRQIQV